MKILLITFFMIFSFMLQASAGKILFTKGTVKKI